VDFQLNDPNSWANKARLFMESIGAETRVMQFPESVLNNREQMTKVMLFLNRFEKRMKELIDRRRPSIFGLEKQTVGFEGKIIELRIKPTINGLPMNPIFHFILASLLHRIHKRHVKEKDEGNLLFSLIFVGRELPDGEKEKLQRLYSCLDLARPKTLLAVLPMMVVNQNTIDVAFDNPRDFAMFSNALQSNNN